MTPSAWGDGSPVGNMQLDWTGHRGVDLQPGASGEADEPFILQRPARQAGGGVGQQHPYRTGLRVLQQLLEAGPSRPGLG
jgi:hypothetical protein